MDNQRPNWLSASAVIVAGLFTLLVFVSLASYAISAFPGTTVNLPLMVVLAVIAMLSAVGFVVVAYSFFGLHDPRQALGLPEGSVRALVALMLVVIFSMFAVYFFERLDTTARPGQADFAKQVVALVGTLLTAVTSFYFASRGTAQPAGAHPETPPQPQLTGITPSSTEPSGDVDLVITGTNLRNVTKVWLARGERRIETTNVVAAADRITSRVTITPQLEARGTWDVVVEAPGMLPVRLAQAFEVR